MVNIELRGSENYPFVMRVEQTFATVTEFMTLSELFKLQYDLMNLQYEYYRKKNEIVDDNRSLYNFDVKQEETIWV